VLAPGLALGVELRSGGLAVLVGAVVLGRGLDLAAHRLGILGALRRAAATAVAAAFLVALVVALGLGFGLDQRLPVGDGDLVVIGMDFAEGQESMTVPAVFDEGGLEGGFDPGDLGEVDVTAQLLPCGGFEVELFDLRPAQHHDPGFLRV
jgi:hypothetical protein